MFAYILAYDSHIAATGHGGGGAFPVGSTSGYDYVGHGGTAPTSAGAGGPVHGHIHHHNGPTGYASATGFGGYGLAHGYSHGGGHGGPIGHGGPHGHSGHGHGHELFGGGGHGGLHSVIIYYYLLKYNK